MPGISIDRFTLEVPGWSEADARRLASAVTEALASAEFAGVRGDLGALRVELAASDGVPTDRLAGQIVSEIVRQIRRQP